uniref:Uncharacterized protein LOC104233220 n=1 Tax=Nicotiana sylvestris TaxID=4096 RepID=A0A1U7XEJ8_NICSY|nr:PREDICTED: uncharacterized protein LOC104233220 [Nicotiana sylvestris]
METVPYSTQPISWALEPSEKDLLIKNMAEELKKLISRVQGIEGARGIKGLNYEDLCIQPDVELLEGYKRPKFEMFDGIGDPRVHLRTYFDKLVGAPIDVEVTASVPFEVEVAPPVATSAPFEVEVVTPFIVLNSEEHKNTLMKVLSEAYVPNNITDGEMVNMVGQKMEIHKIIFHKNELPPEDIAFSVQTLSQFLHQPKKSHLEATLRVVKYVKNQTGHGVLLSSKADNGITAYCDADWSACPYSRKSVTGFLVKFGDSLISWKSKKQRTISRSSTELEYRSLASTTVELTWILGLFKEVGIEVQLPIEVHIDSKLAMQIAANPERGR